MGILELWNLLKMIKFFCFLRKTRNQSFVPLNSSPYEANRRLDTKDGQLISMNVKLLDLNVQRFHLDNRRKVTSHFVIFDKTFEKFFLKKKKCWGCWFFPVALNVLQTYRLCNVTNSGLTYDIQATTRKNGRSMIILNQHPDHKYKIQMTCPNAD